MFDDLNDLYQQVILDHSKSPRNYSRLEGANRTAQGHNPLCGDHVTMYLHLDGNTVKDISWQGSGCAISRASASILTTAVKGKSIAEVKSLFAQVQWRPGQARRVRRRTQSPGAREVRDPAVARGRRRGRRQI